MESYLLSVYLVGGLIKKNKKSFQEKRLSVEAHKNNIAHFLFYTLDLIMLTDIHRE